MIVPSTKLGWVTLDRVVKTKTGHRTELRSTVPTGKNR